MGWCNVIIEGLTPEILSDLKRQKLSDNAIGKMYGVSATAIRMMRLDHNIPGFYEVVNDVDPKELAKLKRQGKTDAQCADLLGVSLTIIRKVRNEHGIIAPKATNRAGMTKDKAVARMEQHLARIQEMYAAGLSYREIGRKINIPESTVRTWLKPEFRMSTKRIRKSSNVDDNLRIIYDWIVAYKFEHNGNSPTQREISEGTGFAKGMMNGLLEILEERGKISLSGDQRAGGIVIHGAQWIPPTGWKRPAKLRKRNKIARPRRVDKNKLIKEGRLCDCGNKANWFIDVQLGTFTGRGGRADRIVLCDDCADYEREHGGNVQAIEVTP